MLFQDIKEQIPLEFTPIFITGSTNNGTSAYFTHILRTFYCVTNHFDSIYTSYFSTLEEFNLYHSNLIRSFLIDTWTYLGKPSTLTLQTTDSVDDLELLGRLIPEAQIIEQKEQA